MEQNEPEMNLPDSEPADSPEPEDITKSDSFLRSYFSKPAKGPLTAEDREAFFYTWYNNGRPSSVKLRPILVEKFPGKFIPVATSLDSYMQEFKRRALELDALAHQQIEAAVIAEKVEMLKRHAVTGLKMQDIAIEYIDAHRGDMSMPAAVRLLVEGVRIERESRGIPEALENLSKMTDEQLLDKVKKLMTSSSATLEELDANT